MSWSCSNCSRSITVHQHVRGGICDDAPCRMAAAKRGAAQREAEKQAQRHAVASAHLPAMLANEQRSETDVVVVVLIGSTASLQPASPERRQNLRETVACAVAASAEPAPDIGETPLPLEEYPPAPAAAADACATCRGFCCRLGGDSAFIDADTIRRVRAQRPDLQSGEIVSLYEAAVPGQSVERSCIFHGERGCTLPRDMRADICNTYFCKPMREWIRRTAPGAQPTAVIVVEHDQVVRSRLIEPETPTEVREAAPTSVL